MIICYFFTLLLSSYDSANYCVYQAMSAKHGVLTQESNTIQTNSMNGLTHPNAQRHFVIIGREAVWYNWLV